jgi:hypothetical protein
MESDVACYTMLCLFRVYEAKLIDNACNINEVRFILTTESKGWLNAISHSPLISSIRFRIKGREIYGHNHSTSI